jgi:hypothetical protein
MAPLAADPHRITRSMSGVLLRFVVRPTRGMHEYGHEKHGVAHYLAFAVKLGGVGLLQLALRYAGAVRELFRLRRKQLSSAVETPREKHDRGMAVLARATHDRVARMRASRHFRFPQSPAPSAAFLPASCSIGWRSGSSRCSRSCSSPT